MFIAVSIVKQLKNKLYCFDGISFTWDTLTFFFVRINGDIDCNIHVVNGITSIIT